MHVDIGLVLALRKEFSQSEVVARHGHRLGSILNGIHGSDSHMIWALNANLFNHFLTEKKEMKCN